MSYHHLNSVLGTNHHAGGGNNFIKQTPTSNSYAGGKRTGKKKSRKTGKKSRKSRKSKKSRKTGKKSKKSRKTRKNKKRRGGGCGCATKGGGLLLDSGNFNYV